MQDLRSGPRPLQGVDLVEELKIFRDAMSGRGFIHHEPIQERIRPSECVHHCVNLDSAGDRDAKQCVRTGNHIGEWISRVWNHCLCVLGHRRIDPNSHWGHQSRTQRREPAFFLRLTGELQGAHE